jgi:hypothetical protein
MNQHSPIPIPTETTPVAPVSDSSRPPPVAAGRRGYALRYGNAKKPLVRVIPDSWRMIWPDGQLSDMATLSRAKDAAIAFCERGPPARNRRCFNWKRTCS